MIDEDKDLTSEQLKAKQEMRQKRVRLEASGFRFGNAGDFLGLTKEEREMVELRLTLSEKKS